MKNLLLLMLISMSVLNSQGQVSVNAGNVAVAIAVPRQVDHLDASQSVRLGTKMMDIITQSGLSASGGGSSIVMYPIFSIENEEVVEGGMQNIIVVNANISFVIQHVESNVIFSSVSKQIRGSGNSRQKAINDAISKVSVRDDDINKFVTESRKKIVAYYESSCANILSKAEACSKRHDYEQAIALLVSIPDVASCYAQAQKKSGEVYTAYQNQHCDEQLQQAQALYAAHSYVKALTVLASFEQFATTCSKEAKALIHTIEAKVSADEKQEWDFVVKMQSDKATLEAQRIEAIQDIAANYYKQKVETHYNLIVK